jgi:predicted ATPase
MAANGHPVTPPDRTDTLLPVLFPRTFISSAVAKPEVAAVTLAQQEMRAWRVLQLDPIAMRETDTLIAPTQLGSDGSHLAATLYRVAHAPPANGRDPYEAETAVYASVANRLYELIGEVRDVEVERDDQREELTLVVKDRDGTRHPARALSDGSLRFLALAVLEAQEQPEVLCIEEPENGVHPGRIQALLDLLQAIAIDTRYPIEEGNPLRQVIISTHSPSVVMRVPADSLVVAELWPSHNDRGRFKRARFRGLAGSWRDPSPSMDSLAFGTLLQYLSPEGYRPLPKPDPERGADAEVRIMDHARIRRMLSPSPPD